MAIPTKLEDLMLEGRVEQPRMNLGPFILCYKPRIEFPGSIITYFYDDNDWGRIAYSYELTEKKFNFRQATKPSGIFIAEGDISTAKRIILEEAKKLDANVLFYRAIFNNNLHMMHIMDLVGSETAIFMMQYIKSMGGFENPNQIHKRGA